MRSQREIHIAADIARTSTVPLDRLPYSEEFDQLHTNFMKTLQREVTRAEFWQDLLSARKRGLVGSRLRRSSRRDMKKKGE